MDNEKENIILDILELDRETYCGIDDPSFLREMTTEQLKAYYRDMWAELGNANR